MNTKQAYESINDLFSELREDFHKFGGFDDSNAKIDEIAKIFATYLAYKQQKISIFPSLDDEDNSFIYKLNEAFILSSNLEENTNNGKSIFGKNPSIQLDNENISVGKKLVNLVVKSIDIAFSIDDSFDLLNEFFGHFIRDNFRGNIEDAQYMTPPEVVDFMVDYVYEDLKDCLRIDSSFKVLDPSCGVGSFLTSFGKKIQENKSDLLKNIELYGQDKVERMVRLSTINLNLHNTVNHKIFYGNSLYKESELDNLNNEVDLILTNPPFGASFDLNEIITNIGENSIIFSKSEKIIKNVDSELLFLDRYLTLLKEGGHLCVVIPEGVLSSNSLAAYLRQKYANMVNIKAIIELPSVTFAQAGTRIKTSILYVQKVKNPKNHNVLMSTINDIGFQVSSKKGINLKSKEGTNELEHLLHIRKKSADLESIKDNILSTNPSITLVQQNEIFNGTWTANHYSANRFISTNFINKNENFEVFYLSELVEFKNKKLKRSISTPSDIFISILHILSDSYIDINTALVYTPKTDGYKVNPGELIFSKINPRIPRVSIVPNLNKPILCSVEFEVMAPLNDTNLYEIMYLLQTEVVQKQILSLTSGTSSSHNRIKTAQLEKVRIPKLKKSSPLYPEYIKFIESYESSIKKMEEENIKLSVLKNNQLDIFKIS